MNAIKHFIPTFWFILFDLVACNGYTPIGMNVKCWKHFKINTHILCDKNQKASNETAFDVTLTAGSSINWCFFPRSQSVSIRIKWFWAKLIQSIETIEQNVVRRDTLELPFAFLSCMRIVKGMDESMKCFDLIKIRRFISKWLLIRLSIIDLWTMTVKKI